MVPFEFLNAARNAPPMQTEMTLLFMQDNAYDRRIDIASMQ
jgi:hypothetical protein